MNRDAKSTAMGQSVTGVLLSGVPVWERLFQLISAST